MFWYQQSERKNKIETFSWCSISKNTAESECYQPMEGMRQLTLNAV